MCAQALGAFAGISGFPRRTKMWEDSIISFWPCADDSGNERGESTFDHFLAGTTESSGEVWVWRGKVEIVRTVDLDINKARGEDLSLQVDYLVCR